MVKSRAATPTEAVAKKKKEKKRKKENGNKQINSVNGVNLVKNNEHGPNISSVGSSWLGLVRVQ